MWRCCLHAGFQEPPSCLGSHFALDPENVQNVCTHHRSFVDAGDLKAPSEYLIVVAHCEQRFLVTSAQRKRKGEVRKALVEIPQERAVHMRQSDEGQPEDAMDSVRNVSRLHAVNHRLLVDADPLRRCYKTDPIEPIDTTHKADAVGHVHGVLLRTPCNRFARVVYPVGNPEVRGACVQDELHLLGRFANLHGGCVVQVLSVFQLLRSQTARCQLLQCK
mmetsp:Transcript_6335/g.15105  ORF Transcript_6335/g.15105 Transcript_6335/m.15105 type:complete len:219 (+) Transcript_6335:853-1509(+)